jgi:hypothetical protein
MYKDGSKSGGKLRSPASDEQAAIFRAACSRFGIDHHNCHERLGVGKTVFYEYGNGNKRVPEPVSKLLDSIEAYRKLQRTFDELHEELQAMKGKEQ